MRRRAARQYSGQPDQQRHALRRRNVVVRPVRRAVTSALVAFADRQGADLIGSLRARGQEVDVYTFADVGDESLNAIRRPLALRVDPITTDDPAAQAEALAPSVA
jgi:glycerophosphoryl diester phosphodiesterase